ncbi:MAG: calcium/sodium antiporter [Ruminococcaceae bacterium]|nr:calcium/sodium antiporter [Oscillospiraceae bacterium]
MSGVLSYVFLLIGFVLLVKGADYFVDGSSSLAKRLKIPSIVIGLTIVAFGTSAPEAAVSISASVTGNNGIVVGNVIGSNIFNLLMVVGVSAIIKPFTVKKKIINYDFPMSIYAALILIVVSLDTFLNGRTMNVVDRSEGIILFVFIIMFVYSQVKNALNARKIQETEDDGEDYEILSKTKTFLYIVLGLAAVIFGGDIVVDSASSIARSFGLSNHLIGLTIVAIGTSLPELVTSVVAASKGESDLALGNVIGSNIFNIFFILGIAGIVSPISFDNSLFIDTIILLAVSLLSYILTKVSKGGKRWHGILYVILYIAFTWYIIIR